MSLLDTASLVVTPNGTKAGKLYSVVPSSGAGDLDVTRATTATRVNSSGLIESVASNIPRLDYTNGTCPSILVEPQRTNNILYSEQIDNILWLKNAVSISANATTSPSGTLTGDKIVEDTTNDSHYIDIRPIVLNSLHTCSIYVKAAGRTKFQLREGSNGDVSTFDLDSPSGNIKNVGNGWFRVTLTTTPASVTFIFQLRLLDNSGNLVYTGNGTSGIYVWGAQLEAGSYATSYIPTTSASVTRNADVISKTGISSLIGQTEGTMFIDLDFDANKIDTGSILIPLKLSQSTTKSELVLYSDGRVQITHFNSGSLTCNIDLPSYGLTNGKHKIAFGYKANDFVLYIDGVLAGTDTSGTVGVQDSISLKDVTYPSVTNDNMVALWKTRLTNTQLAQLTTI
jgi:hypothetical protein